MKNRFNRLLYLAIILCLGCNTSKFNLQVLQELRPNDSTAAQSGCIAVLPFANLSTTVNNAGDQFADMVSHALLERMGNRLRDSIDVRGLLSRQNIVVSFQPKISQTVWMGEALAVDYLFIGTVHEYGYLGDKNTPQGSPVVNVSVYLVSTKTKQIVWSLRLNYSVQEMLSGKREPLSHIGIQAAQRIAEAATRNGAFPYIVNAKCPDFNYSQDIDGDGVLNLADKCPLTPENINGIEDYDGCIEHKSAANKSQLVKIQANQIKLSGDIKWGSGDKLLSASVEGQLEELAKLLKDTKTIHRVMIEAFSNRSWPRDEAETRAFKRALIVKNNLVEKGVPSAMLVAVGYDFFEGQGDQVVDFTIIE